MRWSPESGIAGKIPGAAGVVSGNCITGASGGYEKTPGRDGEHESGRTPQGGGSVQTISVKILNIHGADDFSFKTAACGAEDPGDCITNGRSGGEIWRPGDIQICRSGSTV